MKIINAHTYKSGFFAFSLAASLLLGGCLDSGTGTSATGDGTTTNSSTGTVSQSTVTTTDENGTQITNTSATTQSPAQTGTAVLYWQPPSTNTDGSPLVDLQGYKVYAGNTSSDLRYVTSVSATATSYTMNNLGAGAHYFAVSAYNQAGAESTFSNVATKTINN